MQTEELIRREPPRDVRAVSAALQDLAPPAWHLTTSKGKPVPLSSAGYVLHFRQIYQVRVEIPAGSGPAPELRLVGVPSFVTRLLGPQPHLKDGPEPGSVWFRVQRDSWLRVWRAPAQILYGDLEMECSWTQGDTPRRAAFCCPVVARTRWSLGIIFLLVVWALLTWVIGQAQIAGTEMLTKGHLPAGSLGDGDVILLSNPALYWRPLLVAGLYPLAILVLHVYCLRQRSAELERRYRQRFVQTS